MQNTILIKPATGSDAGLGHLKRCMLIANQLQKHFNIKFLVSSFDEPTIIILKKQNIQYIPIDDINKFEENEIFLPQSRAIILDLADNFYRENQQILKQTIKRLKTKTAFTILIDGAGKDSLFNHDLPQVDLVIRPYDVPEHSFPKWGKNMLSGPEYVCVADEYRALSLKKITYYAEGNIILVSFGGSDPQRLTEKFCEILVTEFSLNIFNFQIVLGPFFGSRRIEKIKKNYAQNRNIEFFENIVSLKPFFLNSQLAIISSGATTRYEAAICRVPTILIALDKAHLGFLNHHEDYGCSINLGYYKNISVQKFSEQINRLMRNKELRQNMSKSCNKIDVATGAKNLSEAITRFVENHR